MNGDGGNELQTLVLRRLAELGDGGRPLSCKRGPPCARTGGSRTRSFGKWLWGIKSTGLADQTIDGLASPWGVDVADVNAAIRTPRRSSRWNWPARRDRLTDPERRL